nr:hypothetical protein [Rubrivivax sp.]
MQSALRGIGWWRSAMCRGMALAAFGSMSVAPAVAGPPDTANKVDPGTSQPMRIVITVSRLGPTYVPGRSLFTYSGTPGQAPTGSHGFRAGQNESDAGRGVPGQGQAEAAPEPDEGQSESPTPESKTESCPQTDNPVVLSSGEKYKRETDIPG